MYSVGVWGWDGDEIRVMDICGRGCGCCGEVTAVGSDGATEVAL